MAPRQQSGMGSRVFRIVQIDVSTLFRSLQELPSQRTRGSSLRLATAIERSVPIDYAYTKDVSTCVKLEC